MDNFSFGTIDITVLVTYFLLIFVIGILVAKREKGAASYFMAGRNIGWLAIGASLFATNISSEHFIGLASSGSRSGLAVGNFEWSACFVLMILGWLFVPFYHRSRVFTMPEFIGKRYDNRSRQILTTVSILAYILTKVSVTLYAGGIVLEQVVGWDIYTSAMLMVVATGIYTIIGGLRAVIYTEVFQAFLLIIGAFVLTYLGIQEVGGIEAFKAKAPANFFDMLRPMDDPDFPWTGVVFGTLIIGTWYWCTDQFIVQKVLSARDVKTAQKGVILAAYLKLLPVFILVIPGIIAYILNPGLDANEAYPYLVKKLLPVGLRGLIIAGLLAALMSSLASVFASCSTLFTFDIYRKMYPNAPDFRLVNVGRLATFVLIILGILWVPFIKYFSDQLFVYIQEVQGYVAPPIAAVFLVGVIWKRANAQSAVTALIVGLVIGATRFAFELIYKTSGGNCPEFIAVIARVNFLHFSTFFFLFCVALIMVISYMGQKPSELQTDGLTLSFKKGASTFSIKEMIMPLALNGLLVIILVSLWVTFG